jgi:hypothetical protein
MEETAIVDAGLPKFHGKVPFSEAEILSKGA